MTNIITETIPDDIPDWAIKAMAEGQLFSITFERVRKLEAERQMIFGWMYAEACGSVDRGVDIRNENLPEMVERAKKDLSLTKP